MLIEADKRGCLREVLVIAAVLAIQDPRERPSDKRDEADRLHARFFSDEAMTAALTGERNGQAPARFTPHTGRPGRAAAREAASSPNPQPLRHTPHTSKTARAQGLRGETSAPQQATAVSDPAATSWRCVRVWQYLKVKRRELSGNQFRRLCRDEYLNYLRVREWQDLHTQLKLVCRDLGMHRNDDPAEIPEILTAVLSGLISHVGLQLPATQTRPQGPAGASRSPSSWVPAVRGSRSNPGRRWPRIHRRW